MKTTTKTRNALCGLLSGLLLLAAGTNAGASTNLIINGGFENPALATNAFSNTLGSPWVIVAAPGTVYTQDVTSGTLHNGLVANSVGDNVMLFLTSSSDYVYQTVPVIVGHQYSLSFLQGKGGDFFRSRGQRGSIVNPTNNSVIASTGYLFPSTASNGSGTDVLFPASLTFTATTPTINVKFDSTAGTRTLSFFDEVVLVDLTPLNTPPIANAGTDFSVNEGQTGVALNGSLSSDPDNDPLTYAWVQLIGGPVVTLTGANTASPSFTAPTVALGGETLSFELTVTANGVSSVDTVSVTVVNVNHPPVAEAGLDQSIAEGSPVTLHGEDSFDSDNDPVNVAWVQTGGSPTVSLTGANTANPSFTAPVVSFGGAPGVVATLVFELTASDNYGGSATDSVTVEITNTNNDPTAAAGTDQTVNEHSAVGLSGAASSDPDSDTLTYAWAQVGGLAVTLTGGTTATPSFTAPFVSTGGADLEFELTVDDGYGGSDTDTVVIHVQNTNDPPLASAAQPTSGLLWGPNHQMVAVGIIGVTDPNNNATITITGVTQDEPTNGQGDGDTAIDAIINGDGTVLLRAERSGKGDGRVYRISFTASDLEGSASGAVLVTVPQSVKKPAIDSGQNYNSTH